MMPIIQQFSIPVQSSKGANEFCEPPILKAKQLQSRMNSGIRILSFSTKAIGSGSTCSSCSSQAFAGLPNKKVATDASCFCSATTLPLMDVYSGGIGLTLDRAMGAHTEKRMPTFFPWLYRTTITLCYISPQTDSGYTGCS